MSVASLADGLSSSVGGTASYSALQQKRAQTNVDTTNSDNTAQTAQYAVATPPVQLSDADQLQASLSALQSTSSLVAAAFSVTPVSASTNSDALTTSTGGNNAPPVPVPVPAPAVSAHQGASNVTVSSAQYSEVGILNISTGTFIPGTGQVETASSTSGNATELARSQSSAAARVLENVLGFQLELTSNLGPVASSPAAAKAVGDAATAARASGLSVSQQSRAISSAQAAASSAIDTQTAQDTVKAGTQASSVPSAGALIGGAQALVNVVNGLASVTANQPASTNAQAAASGVSAVLNNAQISTDSGQLTLPQIGISQSANGQLVVDQNKLKQAAVSNPAGVASLLSNTAQQLGQVASNALVAPVQASDKATLSGVSNGDSPYITQAVPTPAMQSSQPTLLAYSPSAQNLYGLAQYLSVSGL